MDQYRCQKFLAIKAKHENRIAAQNDETKIPKTNYASIVKKADLVYAKEKKARALAAHLRACLLCR